MRTLDKSHFPRSGGHSHSPTPPTGHSRSVDRGLGRRGIRLRSLSEPFLDVDTSTPMGEAIVGIMAVLAQLRVSTIRANTRRGLDHARAQGRVGGRPSVMTDERRAAALRMRDDGKSLSHIARVLGVGKSSVARALERSDGLEAHR